MSSELLINLEVIPGKKQYPLIIKPEDEQLIREATKQLRQKFTRYKQKFDNGNISETDIIAMVAIDLATTNLQLERKSDFLLLEDSLSRINDELKDYLRKQP
jgi:cell division protein ZapA (FtsZ GTPase activity inhibitor)